MSETLKQKPGTPRVALPKIPPWKPATPIDSSRAAGVPQQQSPRSDGKGRQPVDITAHIGARYAQAVAALLGETNQKPGSKSQILSLKTLSVQSIPAIRTWF